MRFYQNFFILARFTSGADVSLRDSTEYIHTQERWKVKLFIGLIFNASNVHDRVRNLANGDVRVDIPQREGHRVQILEVCQPWHWDGGHSSPCWNIVVRNGPGQ